VSDIILPEGWPRPSGYAQGVVASGRILTISGQIGWNSSNELVAPTFLEQALQALRNIVDVVRAAGGGPEHLMRLTWYVVDCGEYRTALQALGDGYREIVGAVYPAMTLVQVAALLEEGARVEIEAMAVWPDDSAPPRIDARASS
jgi:enamine deaminase RidA (YjgF/YER057c/UK114 family)